jgi:hypothetical protein
MVANARASLVSTATAFLNWSHDEANAPVSGNMLRNKVATFATGKISHLILRPGKP